MHSHPSPSFYIKISYKEINAYSLEVWEALHAAVSIHVLHATAFESGVDAKYVSDLAEKLALPFIVEDDISLIKHCNAGGFCVDISAQEDIAPYSISKMRKQLGTGPILGVDCGSSRDHAMQAGEEGADYVIFSTQVEEELDNIAEHIEWWATHTVIPCVAAGPILEKHVRLFPKADFIMPSFSYIKALFEPYNQ